MFDLYYTKTLNHKAFSTSFLTEPVPMAIIQPGFLSSRAEKRSPRAFHPVGEKTRLDRGPGGPGPDLSVCGLLWKHDKAPISHGGIRLKIHLAIKTDTI